VNWSVTCPPEAPSSLRQPEFCPFAQTHQLFTGRPVNSRTGIFSETFPQAIASGLAGKIVSAKQKRTTRRALLKQAGIDIAALSNIDKVDAALCALAAHHLAFGSLKSYGEPVSGLIVVPTEVSAEPQAIIGSNDF